MDIETVIDEEIIKFEEVLHSAEGKSRFDEKAQLLDTKYFTQLTKIVAKLLPKLKESFKKISNKLVIVNYQIMANECLVQEQLKCVETKLEELEGRIETLETPPKQT